MCTHKTIATIPRYVQTGTGWQSRWDNTGADWRMEKDGQTKGQTEEKIELLAIFNWIDNKTKGRNIFFNDWALKDTSKNGRNKFLN
jgi:hypothetical protein